MDQTDAPHSRLGEGLADQKAGKEILTDWETVPCPRCGGSGHYSYCQFYGTTCFKCGGRKRVLTARAQAAVAWLAAQRKTVVSDLRPGMRVKVDGYRRPLVLEDVRQSLNSIKTPAGERYYIDLVFSNLVQCVMPESTVEAVPADEQGRIAQVRAAIAYQNTLTKSGKLRKASRESVDRGN